MIFSRSDKYPHMTTCCSAMTMRLVKRNIPPKPSQIKSLIYKCQWVGAALLNSATFMKRAKTIPIATRRQIKRVYPLPDLICFWSWNSCLHAGMQSCCWSSARRLGLSCSGYWWRGIGELYSCDQDWFWCLAMGKFQKTQGTAHLTAIACAHMTVSKFALWIPLAAFSEPVWHGQPD